MARGWESKSVEEQMDDAAARRLSARNAAEAAPTAEQVQVERDREALQMQLIRVRREREDARHPRHREQLDAAIAHLEEKLATL